MAGTHAAKVNKEKYGKFPKDFDKVRARVYRSFSKPLAMNLQGGKKLCFDKSDNIAGAKRIKLNKKPNTTSTETSRVVLHDRQAGVPNVGTQLPEFGTPPFLPDICQVLKIAWATVLGKAPTLVARRVHGDVVHLCPIQSRILF